MSAEYVESLIKSLEARVRKKMLFPRKRKNFSKKSNESWLYKFSWFYKILRHYKIGL